MRVNLILSVALIASSCVEIENFSENDWAYTGGNERQTKYSSLDQINKSNVANLEVAWVFNSGVDGGNIQMNPLIVDGTVYVTTPTQEVIALNGYDGTLLWRYNPARADEQFRGINRGIAFWRKKGERDRIFFSSGGYLNGIYADDGTPILDFGDQGRVDLNADLVVDRDQAGVTAPAAPVLYGDMVIVGAMTWSSPSYVASFDVFTGEREWIFSTIPKPGEFGYDTWGDKNFWKHGAGVNVWGGLSVDSDNGLLFFATGQPKDDFYRPHNFGKHLFGNSVVALDAKTGLRKWHYQAIHHDLWDLDLPCAPILVALEKNGRKIPGLVQLTKTGHMLLFNRVTGEMLSEVEERHVPPSSLDGEDAYPTQPYVKWPEPFSKQVVTKDDLTNMSEEAHRYALERFRTADTEWFAPPSKKGIIYYGIHGGAEWGGGSYDPEHNMLYVNSNEIAWHITMRDIYEADSSSGVSMEKGAPHAGRTLYLSNGCVGCHGYDLSGMAGVPVLGDLSSKYQRADIVDIVKRGKGAMPPFSHLSEDEVQLIASYLLDIDVEPASSNVSRKPRYQATGYNKFLDSEGYPATAPPWGTMNAIDLKTGKVRWKVPLGEHVELTAKGIPITGTENFGGSIVTGGGLVFISATRDKRFRAFDKDTGEILWEMELPFGGVTTPSTYAVKGKQFVIIPATGGGKLGLPTGDTYIAFSLPDHVVSK